MPHDRDHLLTDFAISINQVAATPGDTAKKIVDAARAALPEIDHVSITPAPRGGDEHVEPAASTDDVGASLDQWQVEADEGPSITALRSDAEPVVLVQNAGSEPRWRGFISEAIKFGIRSQISIRMFDGDNTLGVLNLYSTSTGSLSQETQELARLFSMQAGLAYAHTRKVVNLKEAIATRELIGKAIGVVMERYQLNSARAFAYLVRTSSTRELKLREVARELVEHAEDRLIES